MAPRIEIVDGQVIATPEHLLDFVAVVSWKRGLSSIEVMSVGDQEITPRNLFSLWVGITAYLLEYNQPPKIEKILIDALQSLDPKFTYQSEIERGGQKKS